MSDFDSLHLWIFTLFNTTPDKAKEIKELVDVIDDIISQEKLSEIEKRVLQIENLSNEEFTLIQAIEIATSVRDIIQILSPLFKELRDVISTDTANHLKENLSTFIQVIILVALYKHRDRINIKAILNILPAVSDVAAATIKIKSSGRIVRLFKGIGKFFGCTGTN